MMQGLTLNFDEQLIAAVHAYLAQRRTKFLEEALMFRKLAYLEMAANHALHLTPWPRVARPGSTRSLRSLGAGERGRYAVRQASCQGSPFRKALGAKTTSETLQRALGFGHGKGGA